MYDLIGDLHGHADELERLLDLLSYRQRNGSYWHPERKVIFLGDFIDRGPRIAHVLRIVRGMVESGSALAIMGNHELNALAYHTEDSGSPGEFLRRRNVRNHHQHRATLQQLNPDELRSHLKWFQSLPLWLELEGLRAVHACWDPVSIELLSTGLAEHGGITTDFLHSACLPGQPLFDPIEVVLKGKEGQLPSGQSFLDKDGQSRSTFRTRWYLPTEGHTYRSYALQSNDVECDHPLDEIVLSAAAPYPIQAKPVFIGHYWLSLKSPEILAPNVACLDYSVARGGFLCAYRWNGEQSLDNRHFIYVRD